MDRIEEDFTCVSTETAFLAQLVEGAKPYTSHDGSIQVAEAGITQSIMRYLGGENKAWSKDYADRAVKSLSDFMNRLLEFIKWNRVTEPLRELVVRVTEHLAGCATGLGSLVSTYDGDSDFTAVVDRLNNAVALFEAGCKQYATSPDVSRSYNVDRRL